jgi:hypothetical protein
MVEKSSQESQSSQGKPMTSADASRIQSAGDRNPGSKTAQSGWGPRSQSNAARGSSGKGGGGKK